MSQSKSWWGKLFLERLSELMDAGRLSRGSAYASEYRVIHFNITANKVTATIRGNKNPYFGVHHEPKYQVTVDFNAISKKSWSDIIDRICMNPGWVSKLMLNELPSDIDDAFGEFGLLPKSAKDVKSSCSCPDYISPCKHIAGVYYKLANMLDSDPMQLFSLRGISLVELDAELRKNKLGKAFSEHLNAEIEINWIEESAQFSELCHRDLAVLPSAKNYWEMGEVKLEDATGEPIDAAVIKKQGDYPEFWQKKASFIDTMEHIYRYVKLKNKKRLF